MHLWIRESCTISVYHGLHEGLQLGLTAQALHGFEGIITPSGALRLLCLLVTSARLLEL